MIQRFYSHGKLLLTGEYAVLDGALSLAVPTKKGQSLEVTPISTPEIRWQSFLEDNSIWVDQTFNVSFETNETLLDPKLKRLQQILKEVQKLNPKAFETGASFKTRLEFNESWGLGSSATLVHNIAQWASIDPYELLKKTFGGSGYDIACAAADGAITYKLANGTPQSTTVTFNPIFKEELFFVYLNRKQNSRESIQQYRNTTSTNLKTAIQKISEITKALITCTSLAAFEELVETHEQIISGLIKTPTIKEQLFKNYPRSVKSLGGWGGDFILATGSEKEKSYFKKKGYDTVVSYTDMIL